TEEWTSRQHCNRTWVDCRCWNPCAKAATLVKCDASPRQRRIARDKRRGGRVVECTGLENRNTRKRIEGSNPSLSATISLSNCCFRELWCKVPELRQFFGTKRLYAHRNRFSIPLIAPV